MWNGEMECSVLDRRSVVCWTGGVQFAGQEECSVLDRSIGVDWIGLEEVEFTGMDGNGVSGVPWV